MIYHLRQNRLLAWLLGEVLTVEQHPDADRLRDYGKLVQVNLCKLFVVRQTYVLV